TYGFCDTIWAASFEKGHYGDVDLAGLNAAIFLHCPGNMADGDWTTVLLVDDNSSPEQDEALRARIRSYELAFRMQTAVPEGVDFASETSETQQLYGLDQPSTKTAGQRLLTARRLVERGVNFVQVYPTPYGKWDSHKKLKTLHAQMSGQIDKPIAGLLKDLKRRGLMNAVLVVFCTEFGRTPAIEERSGGTDGRDHHPHGFTVWLAGAGVKKGYVHGATDELGFHAIEPGHYVTDLHATVLHLMGLDSHRLNIPGRKRLEIDYGQPINDIFV
ncbi:MAG: DUF1501 domain-containing protein, partial [Pirellulaceae bacterium]